MYPSDGAYKSGRVRIDPATFADFIGQDRAVETLRDWTKLGDQRGALLLYGPKGVGKKTLARLLGQALFCASPLSDGSPCSTCDACLNADEGRTDIGLTSFDAADTKSEEGLRAFLTVSRSNSLAEKQVIIVDNIDRFEPRKIDVFLGTLEEPPANTTFILLATDMKRVRPAVRSRCLSRVVLRALTKQQSLDLTKRLASRLGLSLSEEILSLVSDVSQGLPSHAANGLRILAAADATTVDEALVALDLTWPNEMIAALSAVMSNTNLEIDERIALAGYGHDIWMRRLRTILTHLFPHEICSPARDVVVDPALKFMKEPIWRDFALRFDELGATTSKKRSAVWEILARNCLSPDHENALDAMISATATVRAAAPAQ